MSANCNYRYSTVLYVQYVQYVLYVLYSGPKNIPYKSGWGSLPLNMFSMVAFVIFAYNLGPLTAYNCKRQVASNNKNMLPYLCQTQRPSMNMFLNKYTYISTLIYLPCNSTYICVFQRSLGRHVFDMIPFNYSHVRIECGKTCVFLITVYKTQQ